MNQLREAQSDSTEDHAAVSTQPSPDAATPLQLPADAAIVLPARETIVYPGIVLPIAIDRPLSVAAAQEAARSQQPIAVLLQRNPAIDEPGPADLHDIGTLADVLRYITAPNGSHHLIVQGEQRFRVLEFLPGHPFLLARIERIEEPQTNNTEIEAQFHQLKQQALEGLELMPNVPPELVTNLRDITAPGQLADFIAGFLDITPVEKQGVLASIELLPRLQTMQRLLAHRLEVLRLAHDIGKQTRESIDSHQREYFLREQLKTIQKELHDSDGGDDELTALEHSIGEAHMPEDVDKQARKELGRLRGMPAASTEHSMLRSYLDWLIELPWNQTSSTAVNIADARRILDEDHYGLPKIKRRILEYLAVRKLNPQGRSPILCFVGPPGVGKTSLGQSIARATARKFVRISLGGTHDEAEIRGHRRTYVGALPGNIIQAICKAGTRDCVLMLDEMDKLGAGGFNGDPSLALLEVLDPQQNSSFRDNYLGVPFDLSQVMFIGTANVLETIPGPLLDRMEVIQLNSYTEQEKAEIARRYLMPRQFEANGLKPGQSTIEDDALAALIHGYTREAGVRNLEREIGAVFRNVAMRVTEGSADTVAVDEKELGVILGPVKHESDLALRTSLPGVATGLAWTPVGGDILFIEASRVAGGGRLVLTGQLGDVMKESAQAALTLVKSRAPDLGIADDVDFSKSDIHIHVPAGAIPKDGPSAGVAIFIALASLLTGKTVHSDTAMTGEISLRGLVLPVGGIKEKVIAASRAGIRTVMLPARNRRDLDDIPEEVREKVRFVWLERVDQAVNEAMEEIELQTKESD